MGLALKNTVKSIGAGILDSVPVINTIKSNVQSNLGGPGKIDFIRLAVALGLTASIIAYLTGKIQMEELERLIELLK